MAARWCSKRSRWYLWLLIVLLVFVFASVQLWDVSAPFLLGKRRVIHLADNLKVGSNEFWLIFILFLLFFLKHVLCRLVPGSKCFRIQLGLILDKLTILIPWFFVKRLQEFVEILVRFVFKLVKFCRHDSSITSALFRFVLWLLLDFQNKRFDLWSWWLTLRCLLFYYRTSAFLGFDRWRCLACLVRCSYPSTSSSVILIWVTCWLIIIIRKNIYL